MSESDSPEQKKYFSISEVSSMLDVKPHVLRYWESQFPLLRPRKSRGGNRMYQAKDLDVVRCIQEMLHQRGYTIAGAKQRIAAEMRKRSPVPEGERQLDLDFLPPSHRRELRRIRNELASLRDWLAGNAAARNGG